MAWSKSVYSTMVSEVGYDDDKNELRVTFANGKTAIYSGVPEDIALDLANAPSVGTFMNTEIKGNYRFRYE